MITKIFIYLYIIGYYKNQMRNWIKKHLIGK